MGSTALNGILVNDFEAVAVLLTAVKMLIIGSQKRSVVPQISNYKGNIANIALLSKITSCI